MKINEFEEKLATVSDTKLGRMLADSREKGPAIAVKLILAEAGRRGLNLDEAISGEAGAESFAAEAETAGGEENMPSLSGDAEAMGDVPKGAWLQEEQNSGMPMMVKLLIVLLILAAVLGGLFFLLNKGG